ncbi:MAG TPA: class I SAM-dependent methyltransferase [Acidimicrobiales bacterium]|nr:class I SAM-dependent methyltransferase [Acidimicrobiales bacterium]
MTSHDPAAYGDAWADIYDDWHPAPPAGFVDFITAEISATNAGPGAVLELAAGTGRLALPLATRGIETWALDASTKMLDRLRAKPGAETIRVVEADMADFTLERDDFALVFVAATSLFTLLSQELQLGCFASSARHLRSGGRFVIDCFVPDLSRFTDDTNLSTRDVGDGVLRLDASAHDPVTQIVRSHHVFVRPGGTELLPVDVRYAWPAELDLMARLAGLELIARYASWHREPFTRYSPGHVSVYARNSRG